MYFAKILWVFFSFLSLKLFLCSFWLYMYLKFSIWSTNLIKCTNSICTYLILALCQIGYLFFSFHRFHSFRDDIGVKKCKNILYKLICWVLALGVNQSWINFESPLKMKKKKKHLKFLPSYGFLNFIHLGFNVSAKKQPNLNSLELFCSFATLATLEAVRVVE